MELVHAIMEAEKFLDLEVTSQRPRRTDMEFQSEGWQAQDTGKPSVSIPVQRQEKN